jgi:hypothetical protein
MHLFTGVLADYTLDDIRISMVYRGRCHEDAAAAAKFRAQLHGAPDGEGGRMHLDDEIMGKFVADLIARGVYSEGTTLASIPRIDLALAIMKEYIRCK